MLDIQGPGSLKKMMGIGQNGVKKIPDLMFARKHLTHKKEPKKIEKLKHLFAFVSSPRIYHDKNIIRRCEG